MPSDIKLDDLAVQRLLSHTYPTPIQQCLERAKLGVWTVSDSGVFGWIGDRLDRLVLRLHDRCARKMLRTGRTVKRRGNLS